MIDNLQLLQSLMAHICHEVAGSIGAIENCLGLIDLPDESIAKQAKTLASEESNNLVKKIQLFRQCYSSLSGEKEISAIWLAKSLKEFFIKTPAHLNFYFEDGVLLVDSKIASAIMCLVVLVTEHKGIGEVNLYFNGGIYSAIKISVSNLKMKENNLAIFENKSSHNIVNITNCREHYIKTLCYENGYCIKTNRNNDIIEYVIAKDMEI